MTTFRIVIRVTTTEDFEFKVEANTREEARGKCLAQTINHDSPNLVRRIRDLGFVSTKAITNPPNKGD